MSPSRLYKRLPRRKLGSNKLHAPTHPSLSSPTCAPPVPPINCLKMSYRADRCVPHGYYPYNASLHRYDGLPWSQRHAVVSTCPSTASRCTLMYLLARSAPCAAFWRRAELIVYLPVSPLCTSPQSSPWYPLRQLTPRLNSKPRERHQRLNT
jgi:hypothetical protein